MKYIIQESKIFDVLQIFVNSVNYPTTKDGWASGITDSPNGNASSCFCLMSDSIP
jgi:hypothetical protein